MAVQQGRRRVETGGGTDRTPWGRSPVQWILANGKTPPALPTSEDLNRYVEDFDEPRTKLEGIFSILLRIIILSPAATSHTLGSSWSWTCTFKSVAVTH